MLTVEDGTGLALADAFVSAEDMDAYAEANDLTDWLDGAGDADAAIRRATLVVSNSYSFKGWRVNGRSQALAWPRSEVYDAEDNAVAADAVPAEVIQATCELAAYERANPGALTPSVVPADRVRRERVGPLEVEYASVGMSSNEVRPVFLMVEDILSGLLTDAATSEYTGSVGRG